MAEMHLYWASEMDEDGHIEAFCSCWEWEMDAYVNLLHAQGPVVSEAMVRVDLHEQHGAHLSRIRRTRPGELAPLHVEVVSAAPVLLMGQPDPVEVLVSQGGKELGRVFMDTWDGKLRFEAWLPDASIHSPAYGTCPEAVEWLVRKAGGSDE